MRSVVLLFWLVMLLPSVGVAEQIFYDDFSTTSQVNTSVTDAYYDADNTLYRLPKINVPQAIALAEFGPEYAVINGDSVQFYQYDGGTNRMVETPELTIPITNPLGLAMRKDQRSLWTFTDTEVKRYDFDGSGMVYNPGLSVLGLNGVVSVGTQPYQDSIAVLSKDLNGKGIISYYQMDETGAFISNPLLSFNTNLTNPLSVSLINGSPDLVVTTETGSHYFRYEAGSGYVEDAGLSKLGLNKAMGHDEAKTTLTVIENNQVNRYLYDGSSMQYSSVLSANNIDQAIALSTRTDNYDFAYITEDGAVNYYTFDGTQMIKNDAMSITGLGMIGGYESPRYYQSTVFTASKPCDLVRLTATEDLDPGSSMTYQVSSDGGMSWKEVPLGSWTEITEGTQFVVRVELQSTVKTSTPRLLDIRLEATKITITDLTVTHILFPPPGQTYPTTTFPFFVRAGSEFTFQVNTDGYVDQLVAILTNGDTVTMTPENPISDEENVWWGRYAPSVTEGTGTTVGIQLNANFQSWERNFIQNPFYVTDGTVSMSTGIRLVE